MSDLTLLGITVLLLLGNAFFVAAEFAVISARRAEIEPLARAGSRRARITLGAMEQVSIMLACAQLGITVCSLGLGALGEPAVAHILEGVFKAVGIPEALLHPIAFAIAMSIIVSLHVVVGEMLPKNYALAMPSRSALLLTPLLVGVTRLWRPLILLVNGIANALLRLAKVTPADEVTSAFTREQVAELVAESGREGLLDAGEEQLLSGALAMEAMTLGTISLPLDQVATLPAPVRPRDVESAVHRTGFSRFPVIDGGEPVGYVHLKDVMRTEAAALDEPLDHAQLRRLPVVDGAAPLREALEIFQEAGAHLALVRDAQGALTSIATLQDVIDELIGEVEQEALTPTGRTPASRPA